MKSPFENLLSCKSLVSNGVRDCDAPTYDPLIGSFFTSQLIFQDRKKGFRYLANAKAGSSALKRFLVGRVLKLADPSEEFFPHRQWTSKVLGSDRDQRPFTFTVVRNPYGRILSAYLDKIVRPGILREQFLLQHNISPSVNLSFRDFLECLSSKCAILDQHYRPQVQNIYYGYIHIDAIWPLEDLNNALSVLASRLETEFILPNRGKHATGASLKIEDFFDDSCTNLVLNLYREDFLRFGYSVDPKCTDEVINPLFDVAPYEEGWFELLSANTAGETAPIPPAEASHRLKFYTDACQAAWVAKVHGDLSSITTLLRNANTVEKQHFILNQIINLPKKVLLTYPLQDALDQLIAIAPYMTGYRTRNIMEKLAEVRQLAEIAKKTTWNVDEINKLIANFRCLD